MNSLNDWKALLRRLKLEHIKKVSPSFFEQSGGYSYKTAPYSDKTANNLTTAIVDFINNIGGGGASRINSTGMPRVGSDGVVRWTKSTTRKGIADIRGTYEGRSLSIEVKIGTDRQSEAQVAEMHRIRQAGGLYFIATDFPSFLSWFLQTFPHAQARIKELELKPSTN